MRVVSRKLPLPTVENCRDLGGIHTEQGRMVRPGLLVRSANLHDARHDDLETLAHRGISNVIVLRTDPERDLKPDRLLEDWSFYALPTFRETKALRLQLRDIVTRPGTFIEDLYPRLVLDDAAVACWKRMFRLLIDEPGGYLFHDSTRPLSSTKLREDVNVLGMPLTAICAEMFSDMRQRQLFKNIMYVGALAALLEIEPEVIVALLGEQYGGEKKAPPVHEHEPEPQYGEGMHALPAGGSVAYDGPHAKREDRA